jgi:predicted alpha/beta hydrolase
VLQIAAELVEGTVSSRDGQPRKIPGALHYARTADGWELGLRRYRGGDGLLPVILCPGYGCSGLFLDYDEGHSLARYLARRGMDAWVLDLRGRGESRPAGELAHRSSWTFDDFVRYDLPAAIDLVRAATSHRRVAWVGHSMGGLALYAYVGTTPIGREAIAAAVTLASPIVFPRTAGRLVRRMGTAFLALPLPRTLPQREAVSLLWKTLELTGLIRVGMNPRNIDGRLAGRALGRSLHNVSLAKLRQLARWSAEQVFCSADLTIDYRAALRRFDVPILIAAGSDDRLARPASVHLAMEEIGSDDRTFLEFGEEHGHTADYGHIDLILGRRAAEEVFPRIAEWLEERLQ